MPRMHRDMSISFHPLSFDEAIKALAQTPACEGSEAEEFGSSREAVPESGRPKQRTAPRRKPSAD